MALYNTNDMIAATSEAVAELLHLPHLAKHFPTMMASFLLWTSIQFVVSPLLSPIISSTYANGNRKLRSDRNAPARQQLVPQPNGIKTYPGENDDDNGKRRDKSLKGWSTHVVAFSHSVLIVPLAFMCLDLPALSGKRDKTFGWDDTAGRLHAISCGYFLWDTLDALIYFENLGFVLHGATCLFVFMFSYRPFLSYYGPRFLLWEISTPFLNLNWFFDRTRVKGTTLQLINGLTLLATFFFARLVYGVYMSYDFFQTLYFNRVEIGWPLLVTYCAGNFLLNGLNWFWFSKMINAVRRRFGSPTPKNSRPSSPIPNGKTNGAREESTTPNGKRVGKRNTRTKVAS